jgi:hypothetical protein
MGASAERYAWPEGKLLVWTGTSKPYTASYVESVGVQTVRGWANIGPAFGGLYADVLTGWRVDVTIGAAYTFDKTLQKMFESATAVHLHVYHSSINGSAGIKCWSGRVHDWQAQGQEGGLYTLSLTYHANAWSAY